MRDFTLKIYRSLILELKSRGYTFQTFEAFVKQPDIKSLVLRHDVDARKDNSLLFARLQKSMDISGTYYFRMVPQSFDATVIKEIASLGHEIGYHYETMDTCRGNVDKAWDEFRRNLDMFRSIVPVTTICMHGSPLSEYDNKDLWKKYDYRSVGIVGEPYFDTDFNKVAYFTDTGRRWNGSNVSIRDKVNSSFNFNYKTTKEIIENIHLLPDSIMFTFHPQRWTDNYFEWTYECILQTLKNIGKRRIVSLRERISYH